MLRGQRFGARLWSACGIVAGKAVQAKFKSGRLDPLRFVGENDEVVVDVRRVVRDLTGELLAERTVHHRFRFEAGLVKVFEIIQSTAEE